MRFARALAVLALSTVAFATTYNINITLGAGTATGQVITDGTLGTLSTSNILDWNITLSDGGVNTVVLTGPLSGNNSFFTVLGSNLSATATQLLFAFTPAGQNYAFFETNGAPVSFLCFTSNSTTCAAGPAGQESILLNGTYYAGFPTGVQEVASHPETFQVHYASNLNIGDSYLNFTNSGATVANGVSQNLCINLYTFDPQEELISCCTCSVTPNGLVSLSVVKSLISNPLTPAIPTAVVIKAVASTGTCNASLVSANSVAQGLLAWGTTLHQNTSTSTPTYAVTETAFSEATLSAAELAHITSFCGFIQADGSKFGICGGCPSNGLGASASNN